MAATATPYGLIPFELAGAALRGAAHGAARRRRQ